MLGFRNLEVEIKATSKTGARRMEVEIVGRIPIAIGRGFTGVMAGMWGIR